MSKRKVEKISQNIYDFWESWTDITPVEQQAIEATKRARELIIKSVPKEALEAIYVKGSMLRREMKPKSDVDMVPVVMKNSDEKAAWRVNVVEILPVMVVPLSLEEFANNQLATKSDFAYDFRARPDRFLRFIGSYKLIYGKPLNPNLYPQREDKTVLADEISTIKRMIPLLESGQIDLQTVVKELFWLVETEQLIKGVALPHSFKGIADSVSDPSHIIHAATTVRENNMQVDMNFINTLKVYIHQK